MHPALSEQMVRFFIIGKDIENYCLSLSIACCLVEEYTYFYQYSNKSILIYIKYY